MATATNGITITRSGQPYPYADREYEGTIEAGSEPEARQRLAKMRSVDTILDRQDPEEWHMPYFREFKLVAPSVWQFKITEAYTG